MTSQDYYLEIQGGRSIERDEGTNGMVTIIILHVTQTNEVEEGHQTV